MSKMIFTSPKSKCDIWKLEACDRIRYFIYHDGKRIVTENFEEVKEYIKSLRK